MNFELFNSYIKSEPTEENLQCSNNNSTMHVKLETLKSATLKLEDIKLEPLISTELVIKDEDDSQNGDYGVSTELKSNSLEPSHATFTYKCCTCKYEALTRTSLRRHTAVNHTNRNYFQCNNCSYITRSKPNLVLHMENHAKRQTLSCQLCEYKTVIKSSFRLHLLTHGGEKPLKCDSCKYSTVYKSNLQKHRKMHSGEKPFKCAECSYETFYNQHLKLHVAQHSQKELFKCALCDFGTFSQSYLNKHMLIHCSNSIKMDFRKTLDSETQISENYSKCRRCSCHTDHYTEKINSGKTVVKCKACGYFTDILPSEPVPEFDLNDAKLQIFKCDVCDYRTNQKRNLRFHVLVHSGKTFFQCNDCEYVSLVKKYLERHVQNHRYHFLSKQNTYVCDICKFTNKHKSNFEQHVLTHRKDRPKPFECGICNYKAARRQHLKLHLTVHTGEKLFKCEKCSYRASRKEHLKSHMKRHSQSNKRKVKSREYIL